MGMDRGDVSIIIELLDLKSSGVEQALSVLKFGLGVKTDTIFSTELVEIISGISIAATADRDANNDSSSDNCNSDATYGEHGLLNKTILDSKCPFTLLKL